MLEVIGSCIGILVGCVSRDLNDARTTLVPTLAPLLIFSGYVVPFRNIPIYFRWAYCTPTRRLEPGTGAALL